MLIAACIVVFALTLDAIVAHFLLYRLNHEHKLFREAARRMIHNSDMLADIYQPLLEDDELRAMIAAAREKGNEQLAAFEALRDDFQHLEQHVEAFTKDTRDNSREVRNMRSITNRLEVLLNGEKLPRVEQQLRTLQDGNYQQRLEVLERKAGI